MIRIHSSYNCLLRGLLLFAVVYGTMSCTDDYFADNGSSGRLAALSVQLPKAGDGDSQVTSARFIAFQAGGAGTSGTLQQNALITGSTAHIEVPVGNSNIYIIGNPPASLGLEAVRTEEELAAKTAAWAVSKNEPHIMVESYRNIRIEKDAVKDGEGNVITLGQGLKRLISKLTVNLQYQSLGGKALLIDSVTIGNRAAYSGVLPRMFDGNTYISSTIDRKTSFTEASVSEGVTTYQPFDFYLSEYLVNAAHAAASTCLYIHAHNEGEDAPISFPVYIGDWFGKGVTYEDFKNANTPAELVGVEGLSVSRNKHYSLTCKLKGAEQAGIQLTTTVKEWQVVNINGDIIGPFFNISSTDIMVNPLKAGGTPIRWESSMSSDKVTVQITKNPNNRFSYEIAGNRINFIHSNLQVDSLTTKEGNPITGKAIITAMDGNIKISKEVTLGVFNPISRFYVRGTGADYDYSAAQPSATINAGWGMDWAKAKGYNTPYAGNETSLHGKDPNTTYMGNALIDSRSTGCGGYWENSKNDRIKGQGAWRLPSAEGDDKSETARLVTLLKYLNVSSLGFDTTAENASLWTSTENGATMANTVDYNGTPELNSANKATIQFVRCIRNLDNTSTSGESSYLTVSHNTYEVSPFPHRNFRGVVPIYYESDGLVSIKLLDENGNDISNQRSGGIPFVGFTSESEEDLFKIFSYYQPPIAFPNANPKVFKRGYFCLHTGADGEVIGPLSSNNYGLMPSKLRKRKYTLLFTTGNLSKSVPIIVVNMLATKDLDDKMNFINAMGVNRIYSGYDYAEKVRLTKVDVAETKVTMAVSDTLSGCGAYYEGEPTDPRTGIGNWFIVQNLPYLGGAVASHHDYWGSGLNMAYGDGANFVAFADGVIVSYWVTDVFGYNSSNRNYATSIGNGAVTSYNKLTDKHYVRCERLLNADILTLSTQSVELSQGASADVLYYTDAKAIGNITNNDILTVSGTNPAFIVSIASANGNSGRIKISCKDNAASGSVANLLIHTEGRTRTSATYKIIKLKVK